MAATMTLKRGVTAGGVTLEKTQDLSSGQLIVLSEPIPANQTDLEIAFAVAAAKLKGIYILSDVAMTIQTNDGTTPDDTITLIAGQPYQWGLGGSVIGSDASPLSADVTSIFVTNTTAGTLDIRALVDPT